MGLGAAGVGAALGERGRVKVGRYSGYQEWGIRDEGVPAVPGMGMGVPGYQGWGLWMDGVGRGEWGRLLGVPGRGVGGAP